MRHLLYFLIFTFTLLNFNKVYADYISAQGINSSTIITRTPLSAFATFSSTSELNGFTHFGIMSTADSTGTIFFDFSNDGVNWDSTFPSSGFATSTGIPEVHTGVKMGRYLRLRYINGSVNQTYFNLLIYYFNQPALLNVPFNQSLSLDGDAISVRGSDFEDEVFINKRTGLTGWNKWAYRDGLTAANGEETIWASTGNFVPITTPENFVINYSPTQDGSNNSATGAKQLTFFYINEKGVSDIGTHTLGNTGTDTTNFGGYGINRIAVSLSSGSRSNIENIYISTISQGPRQGFLPAGESVMQEAIFFNAINSKSVLRGVNITAAKLAGGSSPKIQIYGYIFNRRVNTIYKVFSALIDTSVTNEINIFPSYRLTLNETDVLYFVADTDTNSALITINFNIIQYQNN